MPAPMAKKDARISGYSGEKPCEPLLPGTSVTKPPLIAGPQY